MPVLGGSGALGEESEGLLYLFRILVGIKTNNALPDVGRAGLVFLPQLPSFYPVI